MKHIYQLSYYYILSFVLTVESTTFQIKNVDCPFSNNENCEIIDISSYGSYIYNRTPDRLNYVFWPYTLGKYAITCSSCKWAVFRDKFDKLKDLPGGTFDTIPMPLLLGDKILKTLKFIDGTKQDSAFVLRWIFQEQIPISIAQDSVLSLEYKLLNELYLSANSTASKCLYGYLAGRFSFLSRDTSTCQKLFNNVLSCAECEDEIKIVCAEQKVALLTGLDFSSSKYRIHLGRLLYDTLEIDNIQSAYLYLNALVEDYNQLQTIGVENKILLIAQKYGNGLIAEPIYKTLSNLTSRTGRLDSEIKKVRKFARRQRIERFSNSPALIGGVVGLSLIVLVLCLTLDK
ncbi:MAG: hypothetical protein JXA91_05805 [Candidatus Thermoplasmatota archaeon]|nr:hypothetical protein [Candidatus Thermoplasmatota archaeon]